jgi:uncharacterized membrane protein affecting hemolysin expression
LTPSREWREARSRRALFRKRMIATIVILVIVIAVGQLIGMYGYSHGWQNPQ